mgnify:CR=1 FL=1
MDSRELYPSDEQRRRIMDFIMAAGETLLENGAEVFRVEQTMEIMARSFHLREFHVYVLTNGIFASAGTAEIAEVRNVPVRTTHLGRVAAVNALSREIAAGGVTLDEAEHRLADARRIPFPKGKTQLLAGMSGTACFALIFGGTIRSALAAAAAGFIVSGYLLLCEKKNLSNGFRKISAAALITLVCILGCHLLDTEASHAIIGTLMILTPGIAFTMGIRDFVQGDYLSGTIRMIDALLIAASIAIGTGLVPYFDPDGGDGGMMTLTSTQLGQLAAQFFLAGAGTLSFAVLFACPKRTLPCCALVGAVGWFVYELAVLYGADAAAASLIAVIPLSLAARICAVLLKTPVTVFLLTGIFPLVPGAGIYYTAYYFIQGENALSLANGISTFKVAVTLAVGIALVLGLPMPSGHAWKRK